MIIPYSAKKTKINKNLLSSILKPLTSSLSDSAKSKGARFNSSKTIKKNNNINKKKLKIKFIFPKNRSFIGIRKKNLKNINKTSNLNAPAATRNLPINLYFDLLK